MSNDFTKAENYTEFLLRLRFHTLRRETMPDRQSTASTHRSAGSPHLHRTVFIDDLRPTSGTA